MNNPPDLAKNSPLPPSGENGEFLFGEQLYDVGRGVPGERLTAAAYHRRRVERPAQAALQQRGQFLLGADGQRNTDKLRSLQRIPSLLTQIFLVLFHIFLPDFLVHHLAIHFNQQGNYHRRTG